MTLLDHALAWHLRGYVPLPLAPDGTKRPAVASWRTYQTQPPDIATILTLFGADTDGLGLLTGECSGGLEMLELEGRAVAEGALPALLDAFANHDARPLWDRIAGGYVELTPSGGLHYYYRVAGPSARNTKLARRPATAAELDAHTAAERAKLDDITDPALRARRAERIDALQPADRPQVLIETRGEGGFSVIAPSGGRSHPSGQAWTVLAGSMDTIPTLTADERDAVHAIAGTLDQMPATMAASSPEATQPAAAAPRTPTTLDAVGRPGDDYNLRGDWDVLLRNGWQQHHREGQTTYWTRPGKRPIDGASATTGHADDADRFFCFSSSTEFEQDKPYDRLGVLALLEHRGDIAAAARRLAADGWGAGPSTAPTLTLTLARPPEAPEPAGGQVIAFPVRDTITDGSTALQVSVPAEIDLARYGQTEDGVARALVTRCADVLRYCPQRGLWLIWNGSRWAWDECELHREHAKRLARQLPANDDWKRFRSRALSAAGIAGVIALARTDPQITIHLDELDAHPWELNTPGGTIDMRTGQLAPAERDALHSRTTLVTPDYDNPAPVWEQFLADTFGGEDTMIEFVQRLLGVSAVGQVVEQHLPFAFGPGANGKSTLMNVVMKILGRGRDGYSIALDAEALMVRRHSEHPAELAQLAGARMVVSSEIEDGQRFAEARVKQLTGGDAISARFMRGNPFTFTPTHTLWLVGNHQPGTTAGGPAFWRRIKLLPFNHTVPEERRDPRLEDKLMAEAPQILAWIARGAAAYHDHGLGTPEAVVTATDAYRDDQDSVGKFFTEACMKNSQARVKASELRAAYERFCRDSGDAPVSAKRFGEQLRDVHNITLVKSNGVRMYAGVMPYADEEEPDRDDWRDR